MDMKLLQLPLCAENCLKIGDRNQNKTGYQQIQIGLSNLICRTGGGEREKDEDKLTHLGIRSQLQL